MDGVSSISGSAMAPVEIATAYNAKVISMEKNMAKMQGEMAIKLINAASVDPAVGKNLDIRG